MIHPNVFFLISCVVVVASFMAEKINVGVAVFLRLSYLIYEHRLKWSRNEALRIYVCATTIVVYIIILKYMHKALKVRPGSGFYQFSCILGNMSCLCIHLVTLFNLPCKKKIS